MKQKAKKDRDYSIEEMDDLINQIKQTMTDPAKATDEAISVMAKYNAGYITQTRSRGKVTEKFYNALKAILQNATPLTGMLEERIIRIEAHLEVIGNTVAMILANYDPLVFASRQADLKKAVEEAVNRRLVELRKK